MRAPVVAPDTLGLMTGNPRFALVAVPADGTIDAGTDSTHVPRR